MTTWTHTDLTDEISAPFGPGVTPVIYTDNDDEFYLAVTPRRIVFGSLCNAGLMQSGYIEREERESLAETLAELHTDLSTYYSDGPRYVSRIVCNERM